MAQGSKTPQSPGTVTPTTDEARSFEAVAGRILGIPEGSEDTPPASEHTDDTPLEGDEIVDDETPPETDEGEPTEDEPVLEDEPAAEEPPVEDDAEPVVDEDDEPVQPAKPELHTVKIDGKEAKVSLDELKQGYSRTQDYTRKTQVVAEQRKALETETGAVRQARAKYVELLQQAELAVRALAPETEPDFEAMQKTLSPEDFAVAVANHQQFTKRHNALKAAIKDEQAKGYADLEAQLKETIVAENEKLLTAIPAWKDEAKGKVGMKATVEYAIGLGFTPDQLRQVSDHRLIVLLNKARRWDLAQTRRGTQPPKFRTAAPGAPRVKPTKDQVAKTELGRAKQKLAKSGKEKDAAAAFMLMDL